MTKQEYLDAVLAGERVEPSMISDAMDYWRSIDRMVHKALLELWKEKEKYANTSSYSGDI